ncbi:scavenger receptor class B member 1-like [Sarcoptes scabiei]|nr:scavenger receptor class B member 1-like [Sarcoptes scabiei]
MGRKRESNVISKIKTKSNELKIKQQIDRPQSRSSILSDSTDNESVFSNDYSVVSSITNLSIRADDNETFSTNHGQNQTDDYGQNPSDDDENSNSLRLKLSYVLDELQSTRNQKDLQNLLKSLSEQLKSHFCLDHLDKSRLTLQDVIEVRMKRNLTEIAITIVCLTLITFGESTYSEEIFRSVYASLIRILLDPAAKPSLRSKSATVLSIGCFITDYGCEKIEELIEQLLSISLSKNFDDRNQLNEWNSMKSNTMNMFAFLATICDEKFLKKIVENEIYELIDCLESNNLELRLAVGEFFALFFEIFEIQNGSVAIDDDEEDEDNDDGLEDHTFAEMNLIRQKISDLANDSQKSKSKKELRLQRSTFRKILSTINGNEFSTESVKFGLEQIQIDSWRTKFYYQTFCNILGSGMNHHLARNPLLREVFELGAVLINPFENGSMEKSNMKHMQQINRKSREKNRSKMRDKRLGVDF